MAPMTQVFDRFDEVFRDEIWALRTRLSPDDCATRLQEFVERGDVSGHLAQAGISPRVPGAEARPARFPLIAVTPLSVGTRETAYPPALRGNRKQERWRLVPKGATFPSALVRMEPEAWGTRVEVEMPGTSTARWFAVACVALVGVFGFFCMRPLMTDPTDFVVVGIALVTALVLIIYFIGSAVVRSAWRAKRQLLEMVCQLLDAQVVVSPLGPTGPDAEIRHGR